MDFSLFHPSPFFVVPKNGDGRNNKPPAMRVIVEKKMTSGYGSNFYNNLSNDLKDILPDVKSFSPRNLQQVVANSEAGMIFRIPWGHHIQILTKCKGNRDKALYFVRQT